VGVKESCQVQPFDHKDPASTEPSLRHVELTLEGSTGASQAQEESNESESTKCKKLLHKPLEEGNSCQRSTVATCCSHSQDDVTLQDFFGDFVLHHFVAT